MKMTRQQKYRYESLVRVRDYGTAHSELFPQSSAAGGWFALVSAAVSAVDEHLKNRVVARADARRVKATTRAAVADYMKAIALVARRVTEPDTKANRFRMPRRRSLKIELSTARAFVEGAAERRDEFVRYGLPPTFISEFEALVDQLQDAMDTRVSSKTMRREAQQGIVTELARGLRAVRDLDAAVVVATRHDPIRLAAWQAARRIEGQGASPAKAVKLPVNVTVASPASSALDPPDTEVASPPAVEVSPEPTPVAPVLVTDERLDRAS
jgi:hypothetical protein